MAARQALPFTRAGLSSKHKPTACNQYRPFPLEAVQSVLEIGQLPSRLNVCSRHSPKDNLEADMYIDSDSGCLLRWDINLQTVNRRTKEEREAKAQARLLPSGKRRGRPPGSRNRATLTKISGDPTLVNGNSQGTAQAADASAGTFLHQGVNLHRSHNLQWITLCHCFQGHDMTHHYFPGAGSGPGVRQEPMNPGQASAAHPSGESQDPFWERQHLTKSPFASRC